MVKAYILGKLAARGELRFISRAKRLKSISDAHLIFGSYDFVVETNFGDSSELVDITSEIGKIQGVISTTPMIVLESQKDLEGAAQGVQLQIDISKAE